MRNMRIRGNGGRMLLVSMCFLLVFVVLQTGCAEKETDPVKALVAQSVKAMGGEKKATAWQTRVDRGHLTTHWEGWGDLQADCTQSIKKPDKMKIDQDFSAYDHPFFFAYYYNAGDVWVMVNLGTRQSERHTKRMTKTMRTVDGLAYYLTACDTFYAVPGVPDDSLVVAADIDRIGFVDQGDTVLFDLSKETHLPVRRVEENGALHVLFDDYRKTRGVKMPYHVTVYQGGNKSAEYVWEEIVFNETIDDAIFDEYRPPPPPPPAPEEEAEE